MSPHNEVPAPSSRRIKELEVKGKPEPRRAYSMCSAPHERYLAVTVKEERFVPKATKYPPLLSPLLVTCGPAISKWDREAAREQGTEPQPRFLESALANLQAIGVPNARIKRESYG